MAEAFGLVAVRDPGGEDFVAAFPMLGAVARSHSAGWTWAAFDPLDRSELVGARAEAALRALGHPSLQAWTGNGTLWHLAVYPQARKIVRHVHRTLYNHLVAGRETVRKSVTLRRFLDQYEAGLPEEYRYAGPLPEGPIARAMEEHLKARARALSDALIACGVRHDRAALRDALAGGPVPGEEWRSDVGNLPRVLEAIGLGEAFPGWKRKTEDGRRAAGG